MRVYETPMTASRVQPSMKLKSHESPITKLTNLTDFRTSYQQSKVDSVLNDRTNEIYTPQNASKYIEEPFDKKSNRQKQIEQIRKKYYEQSDYKNNRSVSQKYDKYEIYKTKNTQQENQRQCYKPNEEPLRKQQQTNKIPARLLEYTPNSKPYREDVNNSAKIYQNKYSRTPGQISHFENPRDKGKQNLRPSLAILEKKIEINGHLQKISQASNSNYETVTKNGDVFSPQKNRVKSSFVLDDRSNKLGMKSSNQFYDEGLRNKENYRSIIKETASVYEESAKNSGNGKTNSNAYYQKDSNKVNRYDPNESKVQSKIQPYETKPFRIDTNTTPFKQGTKQSLRKTQLQNLQKSYSNAYPTIYDKFLPKSPAPYQRSSTRQLDSSERPRTLTDYKKSVSDKVKETNDLTILEDQKNMIKLRAINFEDDERMKQIEKRLKERQLEFKKKEESIKIRCEKNYERRNEMSVNRQTNKSTMNKYEETYTPDRPSYQNDTSSTRQNVDKQIQRLSSKIKEYQNRKKQLNIETKSSQNTVHQSQVQQTYVERTPQTKDFENARKALQQYRDSSRPKSSNQINYQPRQNRMQYQQNQREFQFRRMDNEEQADYYRRPKMDKQKQISKRCQFIENTRPMYSEKTLPEPKRETSSKFGLQLFKIQCQESDQLSSCRSKNTNMSTSSINASQCRTQFQIYRRTDEGIEQRKKRLQQNKKGTSQEMKRLVSALSQQSIYDEQFRNCKIWFHNLRQESKWLDLKQALKIYCNVKFTQLRDGTVAQFHICEDENNPFFSVNQESKFTYQALVKSYTTSKKHWQQNIEKKFERNCLKAEGFTMEKIDLEKKGFINLQDFVRFLNFESGNFYRNRDLVLIFKRFTNERDSLQDKSLTLEKILDVISG